MVKELQRLLASCPAARRVLESMADGQGKGKGGGEEGWPLPDLGLLMMVCVCVDGGGEESGAFGERVGMYRDAGSVFFWGIDWRLAVFQSSVHPSIHPHRSRRRCKPSKAQAMAAAVAVVAACRRRRSGRGCGPSSATTHTDRSSSPMHR